jgi:hypothetical protein
LRCATHPEGAEQRSDQRSGAERQAARSQIRGEATERAG